MPKRKFQKTELIIDTIQYDVVIVGAGLAGLSAAIKPSNKNKKVLFIERRSEENSTIRPQLIFLNFETKNELSSLFQLYPNSINQADIDFLKSFDTNIHFGIKDIQRFLKRRINNSFCTFLYNSKLESINVDKCYLVTSHVLNKKSKNIFNFNNLVLSDGAKHQSSNLLKQYISYLPVQDRVEKQHVMAYFTAHSINDQRKTLTDDVVGLIHDEDCGIAWFEMNSWDISKHTKVKFCIVMHVPNKSLFKKLTQNKNLGLNYLKHCAESIFKKEDYSILMPKSKNPEKNNLKYSTFCLNFTEANVPALNFNDHLVALAGDAKRSPDFYLGHGGNNAIMDGIYISDIIMKTKTISEFINHCKKTSADISTKTKTLSLQKEFNMVLNHSNPEEIGIFKVSPFNFGLDSLPCTTKSLGFFPIKNSIKESSQTHSFHLRSQNKVPRM